MRTTFTDTAPVAELRNGMVFLTFKEDRHPVVAVPVHVVRAFCETTMRSLDAWEAEQHGRVVPMGGRRGGH